MNSGTLVVGLGNPGSQYRESPHNLGFEVLDRLATRLQAHWKNECLAFVARAEQDAKLLILAKPLTWMNLSGRSVKLVLEYYGLALAQLVVVCDDLALPFGRIRIRAHGGPGGHNGLKSIIESVGSDQFARMRLGIHPGEPVADAAEYVLQPIPEQFAPLASTMVEQATLAVLTIVQQGLMPAMNYFNRLSIGETNRTGLEEL